MKRDETPCIDICQFSGKMAGAEVAVGHVMDQENGDQ